MAEHTQTLQQIIQAALEASNGLSVRLEGKSIETLRESLKPEKLFFQEYDFWVAFGTIFFAILTGVLALATFGATSAAKTNEETKYMRERDGALS